MKNKVFFLSMIAIAAIVFSVGAFAQKGNQLQCITIQDGTLVDSTGTLLTTGYNSWGYNYQAHLFNGLYCDSYFDAAWCMPWNDVELSMKWNDAWISNTDCDGDGKLDRHYGYASYVGSGAWLTNHQKGVYMNGQEVCKWEYFIKIVAKPAPETQCNEIWGDFCIIQQVNNDPCVGTDGLHGIEYLEQPAGFGAW